MNNKTQSLTPTAIARLRELIKFMEDTQPTGNMDFGIQIDVDEKRTAEGIPSCGTVACIAGWLCFLNQNKLPRPFTFEAMDGEYSWREVCGNACDLLELDEAEWSLAHLFFVSGWPAKWHDAYEECDNPDSRRQVVIEFLMEICDQGYFQTVDENDDDDEEDEDDANLPPGW